MDYKELHKLEAEMEKDVEDFEAKEEDLQNKKNTMEWCINNCIFQFQKETGLRVKELDVSTRNYLDNGFYPSITAKVELE